MKGPRRVLQIYCWIRVALAIRPERRAGGRSSTAVHRVLDGGGSSTDRCTQKLRLARTGAVTPGPLSLPTLFLHRWG